MGGKNNCCQGCLNSGCTGVFRRMHLEIDGPNPTTIEHQFIDKVQKIRSRAWEDIVTITLAGSPVIGDLIKAGSRTILTVDSVNISNIPDALAFELNEGSYYKDYGFINLGYRFCPVSYPFTVSGSVLTARGDESYVIPGFGTIPSGYPCQSSALTVTNQPGSTLTATLAFTLDTPAPFFNENVQALWIGYDLYSGGNYIFDYGSVTVPYTRPSPATIANLLVARDAYIADIIDRIQTKKLVDCDIVVTQQNNWIVFTSPNHVDTVLPHAPFAERHRIGNSDNTSIIATISKFAFNSGGFGETSDGDCCHARLVSNPFNLGIEDPWGTGGSPHSYNITDRFCHEEWLHSETRTDVMNGQTIYGSILSSDPCPVYGQTFGAPCTFTTPISVSSFYSHRVRRYISLARIMVCAVNVDGVPSLQINLRIEATWRTTRKFVTSDLGSPYYNTTPLASLAYNATATESGTGITHSTFSDVFDKTIIVPLDCPIPNFVFDPTSNDAVQTEVGVSAKEGSPKCCFDRVVWMKDLYTPLINSTVTLRFSNCPP